MKGKLSEKKREMMKKVLTRKSSEKKRRNVAGDVLMTMSCDLC